jgi:hypothetical protein
MKDQILLYLEELYQKVMAVLHYRLTLVEVIILLAIAGFFVKIVF